MANTLKLGNGIWGTKENSLLSYNDENGNYKPLPFDFTRASSATVVNKAGLIETVGSGIPRIDFLGNTNGALLLEPQRTNNLLQSNQFDTTWALNSATLTSGQIGVGGSNDAWKLTSTAANSRVFQFVSESAAQTISIYAKAGTLDFLRLYAGTSSGLATVFFNLSNGTVGAVSALVDSYSITNVGNGWYRCSISYDETSTNVRVYGAIANNDTSNTSGNIYIQYAQLEQSSYPTSYIPTQGSTVTRNLETCSQTPPSGIIGQTEGTLFAEFEINANDTDGFNRILAVSDGTSNNRIIILSQSTEVFRFYIATSAGLQVDIITATSVLGGKHKVAFGYKTNDFVAYVDGVQVASQTSGSVPTTTNVYLGTDEQSGTTPLEGLVQQATLYNTRLSNSELATLTTL